MSSATGTSTNERAIFPAALLRISGPKPWRECLRLTIGTVLVLSLGFLVFRAEGLICLVLAVPLALPVAIFGAYMGYLLLHKTATLPPVGAATLVVIALATSLLAELRQRQGATYVVTNSIDIAAPPSIVWSALIHMGDLSVGGQFTLTALGGDSTRVTRSSSYQHNMYPAYYWKLWCDYVARRGHIHVLNVLREDAERGVRVAVQRQ